MELKVLLVGSSGFIGKQIHFEMLQQQWEVFELNRSFSGGEGFFNTDAVRALLYSEKFECIISTAWTTSHATYKESATNLDFESATENLAVEAKACEIPIFVSLGSSAEYGLSNLEADSIDSMLRPTDLYSHSKLNTYLSLTNIFKDSSTRFIWPRIFQPYGYGQDSKRFIPYLISCFASQSPPKINNPHHIYDWINVKDVAKAIVFLIRSELGGAVDVGTGIGTSNIDLANLILRNMGSGNILSVPPSNNEVQGLVMSRRSLLLDRGWKPSISLNSGIRDLIEPKL